MRRSTGAPVSLLTTSATRLSAIMLRASLPASLSICPDSASPRRSGARLQHLDQPYPVPLGGEGHEPHPDAESDERPKQQAPPSRPLGRLGEEPLLVKPGPLPGDGEQIRED